MRPGICMYIYSGPGKGPRKQFLLPPTKPTHQQSLPKHQKKFQGSISKASKVIAIRVHTLTRQGTIYMKIGCKDTTYTYTTYNTYIRIPDI